VLWVTTTYLQETGTIFVLDSRDKTVIQTNPHSKLTFNLIKGASKAAFTLLGAQVGYTLPCSIGRLGLWG
jgi:hypothetical protein